MVEVIVVVEVGVAAVASAVRVLAGRVVVAVVVTVVVLAGMERQEQAVDISLAANFVR